MELLADWAEMSGFEQPSWNGATEVVAGRQLHRLVDFGEGTECGCHALMYMWVPCSLHSSTCDDLNPIMVMYTYIYARSCQFRTRHGAVCHACKLMNEAIILQYLLSTTVFNSEARHFETSCINCPSLQYHAPD